MSWLSELWGRITGGNQPSQEDIQQVVQQSSSNNPALTIATNPYPNTPTVQQSTKDKTNKNLGDQTNTWNLGPYNPYTLSNKYDLSPNADIDLYNNTVASYIDKGNTKTNEAVDLLRNNVPASNLGTYYNAGQSYINDARTNQPASIDVNGNWSSIKSDINSLASKEGNLDFDQFTKDSMGDMARRINDQTRQSMRQTGAAMASRGLAGSGAYNNAMGSIISGGNKALTSAGIDLANQMADRKLPQRGQNIGINTAAINNLTGLGANMTNSAINQNQNIMGYNTNIMNAGTGMASNFAGLSTTERGQTLGNNKAMADIISGTAQNLYSLAPTVGTATVQNKYGPLNTSMSIEALYKLLEKEVLTGGS